MKSPQILYSKTFIFPTSLLKKLTILVLAAISHLSLLAGESERVKPDAPEATNWITFTEQDVFRFKTRSYTALNGFEFTPTADIYVNAIGIFDRNGDGLLQSHPVGIYNRTTQTSLFETSVDSNDALEGGFRWRPVPGVMLVEGNRYSILSFNRGDIYAQLYQTNASHPWGTLAAGIDTHAYQLNLAAQLGGSFSFLGPNFKAVLAPTPNIVQHPSSKVAAPGDSVSFNVLAQRNALLFRQWSLESTNLFYQWQFNGTNIPSATHATITLTNVTIEDEGNYSVTVSNAWRTIQSSNAVLKILNSANTNEAGTLVTIGGRFAAPNDADGIRNIIGLVAGADHLVALLSNGTVICRGNDMHGQSTPPQGLVDIKVVGSGKYHSLVIRKNGQVVAWGNNEFGQCLAPPTLTNAIAVSGGERHTIALKADGTVVGWGDNSMGQLNIPAGLSNIFDIKAGAFHNLALTRDGAVIGWGDNTYGQISIPSALTNATMIAAGDHHSAAINMWGKAHAWGRNEERQTNQTQGWDQADRAGVWAGGNNTLTASVPIYETGFGSLACAGEIMPGEWFQLDNLLPRFVVNAAVGKAFYAFVTTGVYIKYRYGVDNAINLRLGQSYTFKPAVYGNPPLRYEWSSNGNQLSWATNLTYTIAKAQPTDVYYILFAENPIGSDLMWIDILSVDDVSPGISIDNLLVEVSTNQSDNVVPDSFAAAISYPTFTNPGPVRVTGRAWDNRRVQKVIYNLNGSAYKDAAGTLEWETVVDPAIGLNTVLAKSVDAAGNQSLIATKRFYYKPKMPFTLLIHGNGAVSPNHNGVYLDLEKPYTLTATPAPGCVFSNWTGFTNSTSRSIGFAMKSNLVIQANFIPNPFIPAAGVYNGLFREGDAVKHHSSGFISLRLKPNFTCSGKLLIDGDALPFSGTFNLTGTLTKTISRAQLDKMDLQLSLTLDFANGTDHLSGSISAGNNWTAMLDADRHVWTTNNPALPYLKNYTMLLEGFDNALAGPPGYGSAALAIGSNGVVKTASGRLSDDHAWSQLVPVSKDGQWPLYVALYPQTRIYTNRLKTTNAAIPYLRTNKSHFVGSLLGWVTFSDDAPAGTVSWIKGTTTNRLYLNGFTNDVPVTINRYAATPRGKASLQVTNGTVRLSDGSLEYPLVRNFTLTTNQIFRITPTNNVLKLTLAPRTGVLTGSFRHPDNTNKLTTIRAVLLQEQNAAGGYFLGKEQGGTFELLPE